MFIHLRMNSVSEVIVSPKLLRNGMIILFLLTAINVYQTWSVLHYIDEARGRQSQIQGELRRLDAVTNQLCLNMHMACIYTLTSPSNPPLE